MPSYTHTGSCFSAVSAEGVLFCPSFFDCLVSASLFICYHVTCDRIIRLAWLSPPLRFDCPQLFRTVEKSRYATLSVNNDILQNYGQTFLLDTVRGSLDEDSKGISVCVTFRWGQSRCSLLISRGPHS